MKSTEFPQKQKRTIYSSVILSLKVSQSSNYEELNKIVKNIIIENTKIIDFNHYQNTINSLITLNFPNKTEIDFLYENKILNDPSPQKIPTIEDKMRYIGKISFGPTILNENSVYCPAKITNNKLSFESINDFNSIRASNCVTSGKWVYEAQIITNGLQQIGWCQLITPFIKNNGVGDHKTSYAFDGFRRCIWNGPKIDFGRVWDIGDIIACAIDLDNQKIEFFQNGKSMGYLTNILTTGKNIAYFPGVSLSKDEKVSFNFGQLPFKYSYPNYTAFDVCQSEIDGSYKKTERIIKFLNSQLIDILCEGKIKVYEKILLSHKLFSFIAFVSFSDLYTVRNLLFPTLSCYNDMKFNLFWEMILKQFGSQEEKVNFVYSVFDTLTSAIEEYSLLGDRGIEKWKELIGLFNKIIDVKEVVDLWFEKDPLDQMKIIFNSNFLHCYDIYYFLEEKFKLANSNIPIYKVLNDVKNEFFAIRESYMNKLNIQYSSELSKVIYKILTKKEKHKNKTFKEFFNQIMANSSIHQDNQELYFFLGIPQLDSSKIDERFYTNIYYNLLFLFAENYLKNDFNEIAISPFFYRDEENAIYKREINIGGTMATVTSEYLPLIKKELITISNEFYSEFFHKLVLVSYDFFIMNILKRYEKMREKWKMLQISNLSIEKTGNIKNFNTVLRNRFYLFPLSAQISFYKISFYMIQLFLSLRDKDPRIIYFIPIKVIEFPFALFKILYQLKSQLIINQEMRRGVNECSIHFKNDKYIPKLIEFYLYLFKDDSIANPEIREGLLSKVNFFIKKKGLIQQIEKIQNGFEFLMKGLYIDMKNELLSYYASKVLLKIVSPLCFGGNKDKGSTLLILKIKNYFANNIPLLNEFLKNHSKLLNKKMTEYSIKLTEFIEKKNNPYQELSEDTKIILSQGLLSPYNLMCELLKINEFFLMIIPEEFINVSSLTYLNFVNLIKNLSLRIISKQSLANLQSVIGLMKGNILSLGYSIIGIFLQVLKLKKLNYYSEFITKIANMTEINYVSFIEFAEVFKPLMKDENAKHGVMEFTEFIKKIIKNKTKAEFTQEQIDKLTEQEEICILCYESPANIEFIPCKHKGCEECIHKYREENSICFICHGNIVGVNKIEVTI